MTDTKTVKACPACDSPKLRYRKLKNDYHCVVCDSEFTEPTIRAAYRQPRINPRPSAPCPVCGTYAVIRGAAHKPYVRCRRCGETVVLEEPPKVERPVHNTRLVTACPICDACAPRYRLDLHAWVCRVCGARFEKPIQRQAVMGGQPKFIRRVKKQ